MDRRRFLFASLTGALATALGAGVAAAATGRAPAPALPERPASQAEPAVARAEEAEDLLTEAQWGPPPGRPPGRPPVRPHGRPHRRRCWTERKPVRYRDRFGNVRTRWVDQRVCR